MSGLVSDPIFAALTRPQMVAGVTYGYAIFNIVVTIECFLISKSFWSVAIAVLLHVGGVLACLRDPLFFDLWITKVSRCPRVRNYAFWCANSYSP